MVAAPGAVLIEILGLDAALHQIFRRRRILSDAARRRNVIGRDAIAKDAEDARAADFAQRRKFGLEIGEERWILYIGRFGIPRECFTAADRNRVPRRIAVKDVAVRFREHRRVNRRRHRVGDLFLRGPQVAQENRLAILARAQRLAIEIDVRRPRERVRDDERRRREEICLDLWMHAPLEIAIPGNHRRGDEISFHHRFRDWLRQWTAVADAHRAAIPGREESQFLKIRRKPGFV